MMSVELDDNLVGRCTDCGRYADRACRDNLTLGRDGRGLNDGDIHVTEKTVAQILSYVAEVKVEILDLLTVDGRTHILVALERGAELDGMCARQGAINGVASGTTCYQTDLKRVTLGVFSLGFCGECRRDSLGSSY